MAVVKEKAFREDLYYRINVIPISMVPLRHREADVLEIATYFLKQFSAKEGKSFEAIDPDAEHTLLSYTWPGNVRELRNVIRNVVVLHDQKIVKKTHLPDSIITNTTAMVGDDQNAVQGMTGADAVAHALVSSGQFRVRPLWIAEREVIEAAIDHFGGNIPKAAAALEVSPSTIYRKRHTWRDMDAEV